MSATEISVSTPKFGFWFNENTTSIAKDPVTLDKAHKTLSGIVTYLDLFVSMRSSNKKHSTAAIEKS